MSWSACVLCLVGSFSAFSEETPAFLSARPVWPEGRELEKNLFVGFRAVFERPDGIVKLRLSGSTLYRYFVNGAFCGHGPARGPHGYYRVDERDITPWLKDGANVIAVEVAGYNANSYYVLDQPSFLQAEVVAGDTVLAATGDAARPFEAGVLGHRVQKVQRYSFQRPFIEAYHLTPDFAAWRNDPGTELVAAACAVSEEKALLVRGVPQPDYHIRNAATRVSSGTVESGREVKRPWKDRSLTNIGPKLGGYPEKDLDFVVSQELQGIRNRTKEGGNGPISPRTTVQLIEDTYSIFDLGTNLSGFPRLKVSCAAPTLLYVTFDEMLRADDVDWRRLGCVNAVRYELAPGEYALEAFEPYTMRYLKLIAVEGDCTVSEVGLRTYENPDTARATFSASDARLEALYEAGRTTFAQNAVDIFMDCPHRERAGWLCDSFFTARTALALSGNVAVERNFIRNFLLPEGFAHLPAGMLPMCYPADHNDGVFIPNWALWFVVELEEYAARSADQATIDAAKSRVLALFDYFKPFENEDGLLEKLESWLFVEWSKANDFVQDVNYPSNMLYAAALSAAGRLYGLDELEAKAARIRETIREQSFDGSFFVDNAKRKGDSLEVTRNRSEVCQYFAFFFGVATPETHPELWQRLRDEFGPARKTSKAHPEVHEANSFVGNMLRIELLSQAGLAAQILDESIEFLDYMVRRTGTLWENVHEHASLNHGFASHICHTLHRDVLGVYVIDPVKRQVRLRFCETGLASCRGTIPAGDGTVALSWQVEEDTLSYRLGVPEGYTVSVENRSGKTLAKEGE